MCKVVKIVRVTVSVTGQASVEGVIFNPAEAQGRKSRILDPGNDQSMTLYAIEQ